MLRYRHVAKDNDDKRHARAHPYWHVRTQAQASKPIRMVAFHKPRRMNSTLHYAPSGLLMLAHFRDA